MRTIPIEDIKRIHTGHWFDRSTMRFFLSRTATYGYLRDDGQRAYFVSSEQFESFSTSGFQRYYREPRKYTVRVVDMHSGNIDTAGYFQEYASRSGAHAKAKRLASE